MITNSDRACVQRSGTNRSKARLLHSVWIHTVRVVSLGLAGGFALAAFEKDAWAYTDPGTGALIWQMVAAAFVGAAFYFRRFLTWFKTKRNHSTQPTSEHNQEQSSDANEPKS